jgi:hypothetical protein
MSIKKEKDRRLLATFKSEEKVVINFLNLQDNQTNAIRYLIMKEVKENGYRNLNNIIPAKLTEEYFDYNFPELENKEEQIEQVEVKENKIINNELSISNDDSIKQTEIVKKDDAADINTTQKIEDTEEIAECFLDPED